MRRQLNQTLLDGLVGAWSPAAQGRTIGATGYLLPDISGRGNHGTLTNMDAATDWVTSGGYPALDCDGTNDYVNHGQIHLLGDMTISVWFTQRDYVSSQCLVGDSTAAGNSFSYLLNWGYNDALCSLYHGQGLAWLSTAPVILDNRLIHCAISRKGTAGSWTLTGMVNGFSNETTTANNPPSTIDSNMAIGRAGDYPYSEYFNGSILEVLMWNRSLSQPEVSFTYGVGPGGLFDFRRPRTRAHGVTAAAPSNTGRFFQLFG